MFTSTSFKNNLFLNIKCASKEEETIFNIQELGSAVFWGVCFVLGFFLLFFTSSEVYLCQKFVCCVFSYICSLVTENRSQSLKLILDML